MKLPRTPQHATRLAVLTEALAILAVGKAITELSPRYLSGVMIRVVGGDRGSAIADPAAVARVVAAVEHAAGRFRTASCLAKVATAWLMLKLRGVDASVHIGVRRDACGALCAHAWLKCNGTNVLGADSAARYVEFRRIA